MYENFVSVLLTIGSPTLAAYSLALTAYNQRWLHQRFAGYMHPRAQDAVVILNSLQQSALIMTDIDDVFTGLLTLPQNAPWWAMLVNRLDYAQTWSLSAVTTMIWVAIAYVFTLIEAFTETQTFTSINATGQGVGSLWFWLLPIVLLWLRVSPKCDANKLRNAVRDANGVAYVQTQGGPQLVDSTVPLLQHAISISPYVGDTLRHDEYYTAPIYNYSRFLSWSHSVENVLEVFRNTPPGPLPAQQPFILQPPIRGRWDCDMWPRFLVASAAAIFLQWGTTGAAIVALWFSPTIGMRSSLSVDPNTNCTP